MVLFFMMPDLWGVPNFHVLTISDKTIAGMEYYGECMLFSYLIVCSITLIINFMRPDLQKNRLAVAESTTSKSI